MKMENLTSLVLGVACVFAFIPTHAEQNTSEAPLNLLSNGSFEEGAYSPTDSPTDWAPEAWQPSAVFTWDDSQARTGDKSVSINAPVENDARWNQTVDLELNTLYSLSGWIKTDSVDGGAGANLSLSGGSHTFTHSEGVFGTHEWMHNSVIFNSENDSQLAIQARLGHFGATTSGTAWFDDLQLTPLVPMDPHPGWKILVLIYQTTDFEVIDDNGIYHHYVASMTQDEMDQAAMAAKDFVELDIPDLTSGNMIPQLTVRFPDRALTQLSPIGGGWWPSPGDTRAERDSAFDSVIVIWEPWVEDLTTNGRIWIGYGDGLTANQGTNQTYVSMQLDAAIHRGHRNVFKHEWGHSILFFYDAEGTAPKPTVSNHADATQYVNCQTGQFYVWQDETLADPIPNSIYNNEYGFTHDYYSGLTATADQPTRCLGITPEAWAFGGPVSHSGNIDVSTDKIDVDIDIKPGNEHNVINPRENGAIWVAILSNTDWTAPFDPTSQVDIPTVALGPNGANAIRHKVLDINRDGLADLLLLFRIPETGIACGDTEATLTGETFDGLSFTGTESIKTVGCTYRTCYKKKPHDTCRDDGHHGNRPEKAYHDDRKDQVRRKDKGR